MSLFDNRLHQHGQEMTAAEAVSFVDVDTMEEEMVDEGPSNDDLMFDAIRKNQLDSAKMLIQVAKANINQMNSSSITPLYIAMDNRNMAMFKMLLDNGGDINLKSYCHLYCTYETPIVTAARLEIVDMVTLLLDRGCQMEDASNLRNGKTALQWAATHGDISMAELLLAHGADVNWVGMFSHTALHYATIADKPDMARWLLEKGATITANGDGRSALHIAAVKGNFKIVQSLVAKNCPLGDKDSFNFCALSLACLRGHINIVKYLFDNCPPGVSLDLDDGLHKASNEGHLGIIRYLLENGANVNKKNTIGETALGIAAKSQIQTTTVLLEHNAKINEVDNRGYTPLQHALIRDQRDIAALLILHGALLNTASVTESPLKIAFTMSNPILVKYILQAGCHMPQEAWFVPDIVRERIQEADFQIPGSMRFRPESSRQKEAWEWVLNTFWRTRSLRQIARISIREQLVTATGGATILPSIERLPLPSFLKTYLTLYDISSED